MTKQVRQLDRVVIRFAGDSGDGMQLTGDRFTSETAQLGNDISTLPNFPAEIRAPAGTLPGVSSFQVHFADFDILTPGDAPNVLVAMNPAALKANIDDLPRGADIIVNTDEFTKRNLTKVGYESNPLEDGSLSSYVLHPVGLTSMTVAALASFDVSKKDAERANVELSLLAREAELKALRAQIDPHFIFNSLHSISALTATDPPAARRMCLLLADFLRETLRLGGNEQIPLSEELALADRFLAIEQVRLGPRLHVHREADPAAAACLVPPLLLQPLVENAVNHGIAQLVEGGTIRMAATCSGSTLTITLENPCDPDRPRTRGVGLGLELLRKRLTNQYGAADAVYAREQEGQFRVELRIPAFANASTFAEAAADKAARRPETEASA